MTGTSPNAEEERKTVRTTVTLPSRDYAELERLAERQRVSVAWVVRDAVEQYLKRSLPLFKDE
jgi:hypothetical protein